MSGALAEVVAFPETFELYGAISRLLRESDEPNPHRLAEQLLTEIPEDALLDALRVTLPDYIRKAIHNQRGSVAKEMVTDEASPTRSRSPRWEAASAVFAWRFPVGPGEWKLYVDFTADEVLHLVDEYRARAKENAAVADQHNKVARLMKRRKATTVRALGEDTLREIFHA